MPPDHTRTVIDARMTPPTITTMPATTGALTPVQPRTAFGRAITLTVTPRPRRAPRLIVYGTAGLTAVAASGFLLGALRIGWTLLADIASTSLTLAALALLISTVGGGRRTHCPGCKAGWRLWG
jgi:hypothetical protein